MPEEFDAFISYRRRDGQFVADWLHRALRDYRLPPELREGRHEPLRVYMDVLYESATEDFWTHTVRPHLLSARRLIVISTPTSREVLPGGRSNWLVREIETYLAERRDPKVSIIIGAGAFDAPLPADLHVRHPNIDRVDLRSSRLDRWFRPTVRRRLRNGVLTLVTAIHHVSATEMPLLRRWDEMQRQRRRFIALLASTVMISVIALLVAFAAFTAAGQRREAVVAATLRGRAVYNERPAEAHLHFAAAIAYASQWWPPFWREDAADARAWIAQQYGEPPRVFHNAYEWDSDQIDVRHDRLLMRNPDGLRMVRISTGEFLTPALACNEATEGGWLEGEHWIVVPGTLDDRSPACVMTVDGRTLYPRVPGLSGASNLSVPAAMVAPFDSLQRRVQLWSLRTSAPIGPVHVPRPTTSLVVRFSPNGRWLVVCGDDELTLIDDTGRAVLSQSSRGTCEDEASQFGLQDTRWIVDRRGAPLKVFEPPREHAVIEIGRSDTARWTLDSTGRYLASSSEGHAVGVWDLETRQRLYTAKLSGSPDRLAILPGRIPRLAVLENWSLHLWVDGREALVWPRPSDVSATAYELRVSSNGSHIAVRAADRLAVWALDRRTAPVVVRHMEEITAFDFDSTGRLVATASRDGFVRVWRTADGSQVGEPLEHRAAVDGVQFLPNDTYVISWAEAVLRVWRVLEPNAPIRLTAPSVAITPSPVAARSEFVSIGEFGDIRLHDAAGAERRRFRHEGCATPTGRTQEEAMSSAVDRYVRTLHRGEMTGAYSTDGRWLATWKCDRAAIVWDIATGRPVTDGLVHGARVEAAALGRGGRYALTGAEDGSAQLWALPEGKRVGPPVLHGSPVIAVALSPDERVAATATISELRLWNATTGGLIFQAPADGGLIEAVEYSSDGRRLLVRHTGEVRMYDVSRAARELFRLQIPGASAAHFDRAGLRIVVASTDNIARVYDARTGVALGAPMVHQTDVVDARFGISDTRVVTASGSIVQVWEASSGAPIGRAMNHSDACTAASFTVDGMGLLTLCGTAHIWDWRTDTGNAEDIVRRAEASTGFTREASTGIVRHLTPSEWSTRIHPRSER